MVIIAWVFLASLYSSGKWEFKLMKTQFSKRITVLTLLCQVWIGFTSIEKGWCTPELPPGDDREEVPLLEAILEMNFSPEQKLFFKFDSVRNTNDPKLIETFLTEHPELNLNHLVELGGDQESPFGVVVEHYRSDLLDLQDIENDLATTQDQEWKKRLSNRRSKIEEIMKNRLEIIKNMMKRGADPAQLKLENQPEWAGGKDMGQINMAVNAKLGIPYFEDAPPPRLERTKKVIQSSSRCNLNNFAPGVRDLFEKINDFRKTKKKKVGELVHLYSTTEDPGCQLTLILKQRILGGYPDKIQIDSARIFDGDQTKELQNSELQTILGEKAKKVTSPEF